MSDYYVVLLRCGCPLCGVILHDERFILVDVLIHDRVTNLCPEVHLNRVYNPPKSNFISNDVLFVHVVALVHRATLSPDHEDQHFPHDAIVLVHGDHEGLLILGIIYDCEDLI